jgi:hypothetical protein
MDPEVELKLSKEPILSHINSKEPILSHINSLPSNPFL